MQEFVLNSKWMERDLVMIPYINEFGHLTHQLVEYEWVPDSRSKCKKFGHTINKCTLNPRMIAKWVPKQDPSNTVSSKVEEEPPVVEEDCGTTGDSSEVLESMDGGKTECIMVEPTLISEIQMVELSSVCKGQANGSVFGNAEQFQPTGTF
ncbi:hypothetical protein ACH5RR_003095 [Cinchona calisaya]|uniref:DUF4283 domain-containing protein n=1 Tax=Cinchona calisaya TaxID=153742 RepID=A0ABD3AUF1_9GENT